MGWWSKDIMGGDTPLDAKDEIYHICGVDEWPAEGGRARIPKERFEEKMPDILKFLRAEKNQWDDNRAIGFQVLGVLMMGSGAAISKELKLEILAESGKDLWAKEDEDRKKVIADFTKKLTEYEGSEQVEIRSKGLFEAIADRLDGESE